MQNLQNLQSLVGKKKYSFTTPTAESSGTLLETFESLTNWSSIGDGGSAIALDATYVTQGSNALRLTTASGGNCIAQKVISANLATANTISFDVYIVDKAKVNNINIYLSSTTGLSKFFLKTFSTNLHVGWNRIRIAKTSWTNSGGESWDNTMVRLRILLQGVASQVGIAHFDNLVYGTSYRPRVIFTFDDGWDSVYSEAFSYMSSKSMNGVCYIPGSKIDTANYMTLAQLQELYAEGWDLCNHTYNHTNLTSLATQQDMQDEIALGESYLTTNGFTRGNMYKHLAYPGGLYNDTVRAAVVAQECLTARSTTNPVGIGIPTPLIYPYILSPRGLDTTVSLATAKADVDYAIEAGITWMFYGHKIVESPVANGLEWAISDFQELVDYVATKRDAGTIDCLPLSAWYNAISV